MARIAFVQEELRARFGIMILSAVLKQANHTCDVFIHSESRDIVSDICDYKPDIVAFSAMTPGIDFALRFANEIKKKTKAFILMGGPHPTFYPHVLNENCIDGICLGEGEYAFLELANAFDNKEDFTGIKNLWIKKGDKIYKNDLRPLIDINSLPMMDRELYYAKFPSLAKEPTKKFFVVRGCPFDCTYCFNHSLKKMYAGKGQYVRLPEIGKLIAEIKYVRQKYGVKWVQLNADTFNVNRKWVINFLDKYKKEINIPFLCNLRIDMVDEDLVKALKDANCNRVDFAIENGDQYILNNVLKRRMTPEQIIKAGKLFKKYKIRTVTSNIIGSPHETLETAMKTLKINQLIRPEIANCFILQPYPGTEIHAYSIEAGFLESSYSYSKDGTGFQVGFEGATECMPLNLKQSKQLKNLVYFFDFLVKYPFFGPLAMLFIHLPPNRFFRLVKVMPILMQDFKYTGSLKRKMRILGIIFKIILFNK